MWALQGSELSRCGTLVPLCLLCVFPLQILTSAVPRALGCCASVSWAQSHQEGSSFPQHHGILSSFPDSSRLRMIFVKEISHLGEQHISLISRRWISLSCSINGSRSLVLGGSAKQKPWSSLFCPALRNAQSMSLNPLGRNVLL